MSHASIRRPEDRSQEEQELEPVVDDLGHVPKARSEDGKNEGAGGDGHQ
jgi:N-dimethylarginine dimethylaminohydrolase